MIKSTPDKIEKLKITRIKNKFNRAEIFDEVDKSNERFNHYTPKERKVFRKNCKELLELSKNLAKFEEESKRGNLIVGQKLKK